MSEEDVAAQTPRGLTIQSTATSHCITFSTQPSFAVPPKGGLTCLVQVMNLQLPLERVAKIRVRLPPPAPCGWARAGYRLEELPTLKSTDLEIS